jgi:hypothetical protein
MLQAKLSQLPKELIIKILLKVKKEKVYKVKIRNGYKKKSFYVKAQSRDTAIRKMRNNKEIKLTILEMFQYESDHSDICLYINEDTGKILRGNYRSVPRVTGWQFLRNFDGTLLESHFDELFDDYIEDEDQNNISIEEIIIF